MRNIRWVVALMIAVLSALSQQVLATDFIWVNTTSKGTLSTGANWAGGGAPAQPGTFGDNFFLTNNLGTAREVVAQAEYDLNNLVATNTGTALRTITLNNGVLLRVQGTTWVGSNTLINVGSNTTGGSTLSNNTLYLLSNGQITFLGNSIAGQSTLVVGGVFTNTSTSIIDSASGVGRLLFSSTANIVTNQGVMSFVTSSASQGQTNLVLQVGDGTVQNTFYNKGTLTIGIFGSTTARNAMFSNQLVNAGMLVITNNSTSNGGSYSFMVTGIAGAALTNEATGIIRSVADGSGTGVRNVTTLNAGGLVNRGTLTFLQTGGSAGNNNDIVLATAGTTFSNAVGGQVVLESGNVGNVRVLADRSVNLGTNLVNGGTLNYLDRTGGTTASFSNSGTILLNQAALNVGGGFYQAGQVLFKGASSTPDALIVAGAFANTTASIMTNAGKGSVTLQFSSTASPVTNNGLMQFVSDQISGGSTGFVLQVGNNITANTFFNNGSFVIATSGAKQTRHYMFSNQFINAGMFVLTNSTTGGAPGDSQSLSFNVSGITGTSITNLSTGTMKFLVAATSGNEDDKRTVMTVNKGGFVNLGTLSFLNAVTNNNNDIRLQDGAGIFSNAAGGQLILEAGNLGDVRIQASGVVNLGTNIITGGRLRYQSFNNTDGIALSNAGVIIVNSGGGLTSDKAGGIPGAFINLNGGLIETTNGTGTIFAMTNSTLSNLAGARIVATNGTLTVQQALLQQGTLEIREGGTLAITNTTAALRDWNNAGTVLLSSGNLQSGNITNDGTIRGSATLNPQIFNNAAGILEATNGTLTLALNPAMLGTAILRNDGTLLFGATGNLVITNAGKINLYGGTLRAGEMTNLAAGIITTVGSDAAVLSNRLINLGIVNVTNATLTVFNGITNAPGATIFLRNTGTLAGSVTNLGIIAAAAGGNLDSVFNAPGGAINATNGTLVFLQNPTMQGTLNVGETVMFGTTAQLILTNSSSGLINLAGGTIVDRELVNQGHLASVSGGLISNGLVNSGFIDATNGTLTVTPDLINLSAGIVTNSATLQVGSTGIGTVSNAGILVMGGGTFGSGQVTNTGIVTGNGTLTGALLNNGTVAVTNGSLRLLAGFVNNATLDVAASATLSNGVAAINAGTFLLNGGSLSGAMLTNAGTLAVTGGTISAALRNQSAGQVNVTGTLTFNQLPGTVVTNAGSYTLGGTYWRVFATDGTTNDFRNEGVFTFNNGTIAAGNFVNAGALNAALAGTGTINGQATTTFSNATAGAIFVNSGTVMVNGGTFANQGKIDTYGSGVIGVAGGWLVNGASGQIINTNSAATLGVKGVAGSFANYGAVIVSNGATISIQNTTGTGGQWSNAIGGAVQLINGILNTGTINNSGALVGNNGTIILSVGGNAPRPIVQSATGQIIVTNGGDLTIKHLANDRLSISGGTLAVGAGSTLRIFTDLAAQTNAILLNGANLVLNGGTIVSANITNSLNATIAGAGTLSFKNGPLAGGVDTLANAGSLLAGIPGALVLDGGTVLNLSNGFVSASTGSALIAGVNSNAIIVNAGGATISMAGGSLYAGSVTNLSGGLITGSGTIAGAVVNLAGGVIESSNGTLRLLQVPFLSSTMNMLSGGALQFGVTGNEYIVTNQTSGTINFAGGTLVGRDVVNLGHIASVSGGLISNALVNAGFIDVTNGTLVLFPDLVNFGVITNGATLTVGAGTVTNSGTLVISGGNFLSGQITNTGLIVGQGTLTGLLLNQGNTLATNGALRLLAGLQNSGTLDVATGATLTNGAASINTGTVRLKGGSLDGAQFNNTSTFTAEAGTISAALRNQSGGLVDITGALTIFTPAGAITTNAAGATYKAEGSYLQVFATNGSTNSFHNEGLFAINSGTIAVADFINAGAVVVALTGTGTISSPSGNAFSNAGVVLVNSGTMLYGGGTIVNTGVINAGGTSVFGVNAGGGFTNASNGLIINTNSSATLGLQAGPDRFGNSGNIVVSNGATLNMQDIGGAGTRWDNAGTVRLAAGVLNSGTINNDGSIVANNATINLSAGGSAPVPFIQGATGQLIVTNSGTLTITHLANDRLSLDGGTLTVGSGSTLRIYTDLAAQTNALLVNMADIRLVGGTLLSADVTNHAAAIISGFGTLSFNNGPLSAAGHLVNTGAVVAAGTSSLLLNGPWVINQGILGATNGSLIVTGVLTNQGTVSFFHSVGTFQSAVVNAGVWVTDPTTNIFQGSYTLTASGAISATGGDVYQFRSNFVNQSVQNAAYDTLNTTPGTSGAAGTKFVFDGTNTASSIGYTQHFFTAGLKLTGGFTGTPASATETQMISSFAAVTGFQNNFALDRLEIGNLGTNSILQLTDAFPLDGNKAGLFVNDLWLFGDSQLVLSNNTALYFVNSNNWSMGNITLLGNAELHQLVLNTTLSVVPEPSTLMLLLAGGVILGAYRRRARRSA